MATPLIPPIDWTAYDFSEPQPYFATAFNADLAELDANAAAAPQLPRHHSVILQLDLAASLDPPMKALDEGLAFEDQEAAAEAALPVSDPADRINQGFLNNETTIGKIPALANKLPAGIPPIAAVPVTPAPVPLPQPAPKLPPVVGGVHGAPLSNASAVITNINRPDQPRSFRVGDPWQITIKAPAGSPIYVVAARNGVSMGQSPFGVVPLSGVMLLHGTFTAEERGAWHENWYAQSAFIGQILFIVE